MNNTAWPNWMEMQYRPGTLDQFAAREVLECNEYLKTCLEPFLKGPGIALDIGAQIGSFSILAARVLEPAAVLAVEPENSNFDILSLNIRHFGLENRVKAFNLGLWDAEKELPLFIMPENSGGHSLIPDKAKIEGGRQEGLQFVKVTTLDSLLANQGLAGQPIKIIKIDTEGAEVNILKGAARALAMTAVIVGEMHESVIDTAEFQHVLADFFVVLGEPMGPLQYRNFWAVNRSFGCTQPEAVEIFLEQAPITALRDFIWKQKHEIAWRDNRISDLEAALNERENALNAIRDSLSWRVMDKYHRMIDALFPQGSLRRRGYDRFYCGLLSFLKGTWGLLFHHRTKPANLAQKDIPLAKPGIISSPGTE